MGIVVSRSEIYTTESGKTNGSARASAQLNANNITIYDSYFDERYKSKRTMAIIHEGSHAIFGRTDGVYTSRNVDDARNFSAGYDKSRGQFHSSYRWPGVEFALVMGQSNNHNDTYVCQVVAGC